ncbi:DUF1302 domain-containing protein [Marinobacterium sediminicola]|uniref:DUF1302 domain-containing protein n=1 Tax=Marinobacterium sediminicola TaxID=518898 RepID=A0ABY1S2W8_9GAMM|nr:DUF1302 domain-containing protein [Marinobacterium sediminicola]ULG70671.1 DUF1302 domain-containing protein [Marinobacterium sediminicola]SMR77196.1 Protein of unknown function [Marinobacterium sediminicola]
MEIKNGTLSQRFRQVPGTRPALLSLLVAAAPFAQALQFNLGDVEGRFDSQLSVGASWRLNAPDPALISAPNGGTSNGSGSYDDGNQNFERGETFSKVFKGMHELDLRYDNIGLFARGKYWFDFELEQEGRPHGHAANGYQPGAELNDDEFNDYAQFSGAELLDAYLYGGFDLGSEGQHPLDLRIGRQVVNWGESAFIQGGINSINTIDVSAIRRPGAEVRDALLPANQIFASLGLNENLSVEGFYQLQWEPTAIDGCGTYFSTNDFAAEGCNGIRIPLPLTDQQYFDTAFTAVALGFDPVVYRHANGRREADDDGQFGVAFRYFSEALNNTEFGLFYARYHSRLPVTSGVNTPVSASDLAAIGQAAAEQYILNNAVNPAAPTADELAAAATAGQTAAAQAGAAGVFQSRYFTSYPEEIDMVGLSFNTNLGNLAWSGEVSHKRDVPVQVNGPLLVGAILTQFSGGIGNTAADQLVATAGAGGEVKGYGLFDITQVQTSLVSFHDRVLGASRLALIGELGWTHVHGLDEGVNALKYGRAGTYGYSAGDDEGFVTQDSLGYVVRASLTYPNAIAGASLTPEISFKHGIYGNGPEPGAAFREDEKALGLTLTADYLNQYRLQLGYTNFFGGDFNAISDRDFLSLSASVSF